MEYRQEENQKRGAWRIFKKPGVPWSICFVLLIFLVRQVWVVQTHAGTSSTSACNVEPIRSGGYTFINPLLLCEVAGAQEFPEFKSLKEKLSAMVQSFVHAGTASNVSIYFRDYTRGSWVTIGDIEQYVPASLMKVPIMIAFLKMSESHPELLSKQIVYRDTDDYNAGEYFQPTKKLVAGTSYTIEELLRRMVVYSDNAALKALADQIDIHSLREVFTDLGLDLPPETPAGGDVPFITVKEYAYFFRLLYNATYLNRANSEQALRWLSEATFSQGIRAGIPDTVPMAQKFGERVIDGSNQSTHELHDCGIIYYPHHPYLLCVMTRGNDFDALAKVIAQLSRTVFDEIKASH